MYGWLTLFYPKNKIENVIHEHIVESAQKNVFTHTNIYIYTHTRGFSEKRMLKMHAPKLIDTLYF